jgi:pimeloyl-ACP methyl ester carboxylesterase
MVRSVDGVRIAVHDLGSPDDAAADILLFSHATGFHALVWAPMAAELSHRFRCLAIDHRGHGVSDVPPGTSFEWSRMGRDVVAVLESDLIGPARRVHGVGHSMGGAALALAARVRPGALHTLWLYEPVIVASGLLSSPDGPNPMADAAERRRDAFASAGEALANYGSKPPLDQLRPDALRAYVDGGFAPQPDGTVVLRCAPATEAAVFRGAGESGAWEVMPDLDLPIAVVAGRDDEFGPVTFAPAIVAAALNATLVERRHLGHFGPLEDPTAMAADLVAWVDAHP